MQLLGFCREPNKVYKKVFSEANKEISKIYIQASQIRYHILNTHQNFNIKEKYQLKQ